MSGVIGSSGELMRLRTADSVVPVSGAWCPDHMRREFPGR